MSSKFSVLLALLGFFLGAADSTFGGSSLHAATPALQGAVKEERLAGKVFLTIDEALKLAFPGCKVERTTAYLSVAQQKAISKACGGPFKDRVVYPYVAKKDGKVVGTAYFDTHKVRSLRQTLMVVVTPEHKLKRVELLAFAEPRQYLPKPKWLKQFVGQVLNQELRIGAAIRPMSGATLTANASLACSRRQLALHMNLNAKAPKPEPPSEDPPKPAKKSGADKSQTPKSKSQTPKTKSQTPKTKSQTPKTKSPEGIQPKSKKP